MLFLAEGITHALPNRKPSTVILGTGRKQKQIVERRIKTVHIQNERVRPSEATANTSRVETGQRKARYSEVCREETSYTGIIGGFVWPKQLLSLQGPLR